jgi:tungstate transport system substrate-binding protein
MRWIHACLAAALAACGRGEPPLEIGATHTLEQSGALAVLDSLWTGPRMAVIVGPSGQILRAAANGDLDIVITHAPTLERRLLIEPGGASTRCPLFASRFAIVGPADDPARVRSAPGAADAFRRIATTGAPFVSRGDSSGTHIRELALWRAAGVDPNTQSRRIESGADQATTLRLAEARDAYALADLPTLIRQRDRTITLLFETDTMLVNPYTLYVVRKPRPHPAAAVFVRWAVRTWRPALGTLRLPDGSAAFEPAAAACSAPFDSVMP